LVSEHPILHPLVAPGPTLANVGYWCELDSCSWSLDIQPPPYCRHSRIGPTGHRGELSCDHCGHRTAEVCNSPLPSGPRASCNNCFMSLFRPLLFLLFTTFWDMNVIVLSICNITEVVLLPIPCCSAKLHHKAKLLPLPSSMFVSLEY
jgi:hypothetical protein